MRSIFGSFKVRGIAAVVRGVSLGLTSAAVGMLAASPAMAGPYPDKPITLVVGYAPGGGVDTVGRLVGRELSKVLNQTVVIENRPGAGATIAASYVGRSAADGYTLLVGDVALVTSPHLMKRVPYNLDQDFVNITPISSAPLVMSVPVNSPHKSLADVINFARVNQDKGASFSSAGNGTTPHLSGEILRMRSNTNMIHVAYKGSGPAMTDLVAGRLDFAFATIAAAKPFITQERLRPLATTGLQRSPEFPNIPTVAETYPGFQVTFWTSLLAPSKTPPEIVEKLNKAMQTVLALPETRAALQRTGETAHYLPLAKSKAFLAEESSRWKSVITEAKVEAQ